MAEDSKGSFMDQFMDAVQHGNEPPKASEALTRYSGAATILSIPAHDPRNLWREYLCVKRMHPQARVPTRGSAAAAGYDLYAFDNGQIIKRSRGCVGTQIKIAMPPGVYGRIASRSGLSFRSGIEVGAGVIDADYQGEIKVILYNHSDQPFTWKRGDRIAQLILEKYSTPPIKEVSSNTDLFGVTMRGTDGLGSTGV